ncbi:MAG: hypothetical protein WD135_06800, partial [Ferruginibacter sp.]
MKKIGVIIFFTILVVGAFFAWKVFGPSVRAPVGTYFYIRTGSDYKRVTTSLKENNIISDTKLFEILAKRAHYP